MTYHEAEQRIIRDASIIRASEEAFEKGIPCKYTEEQVLEAQKKIGSKQLDEIYERITQPSIQGIINTISSFISAWLPMIFYFCSNVSKFGILISYFLMGLSSCIFYFMPKSVKKCEKPRRWTKHLTVFSNHVFWLQSIFTFFGYVASCKNEWATFSMLLKLSVIIPYVAFLFLYICLFVFYVLKPCYYYLRKRKIYEDSIPTDLS